MLLHLKLEKVYPLLKKEIQKCFHSMEKQGKLFLGFYFSEKTQEELLI